MSIDLIGVTAMGGLPLFARHITINPIPSTSSSKPVSDEIPFATLAALNGVNLFSRLNDANLRNCFTKDSKIIWKVYKGSIVLILVATNVLNITHDQMLEQFLDLIFDCLILICGVNEVTSQNIEKLKKCLRMSYELLDHVMTCLSSFNSQQFSLLTNCIEYDLNDDNHDHHDFTSSLVESVAQFASSSFCALFINHKLYSASKQWWTRLTSSKDALLISLLINSLPTNESTLCTCKEMHIFLPENCPHALTRLIVISLFPNVTLCLLCTENPKLEMIESEIIMPLRDSKIHQDKFARLVNGDSNNDANKDNYLANTLSFIKIDEKLSSFVIVRDDMKIFSMKSGQSLDETKLKTIMKLTQPDISSDSHFESYLFSEKMKCYHIRHEHFRIYAMFVNEDVNLTLMRNITNKTLNTLIRDKHIWP